MGRRSWHKEGDTGEDKEEGMEEGKEVGMEEGKEVGRVVDGQRDEQLGECGGFFGVGLVACREEGREVVEREPIGG